MVAKKSIVNVKKTSNSNRQIVRYVKPLTPKKAREYSCIICFEVFPRRELFKTNKNKEICTTCCSELISTHTHNQIFNDKDLQTIIAQKIVSKELFPIVNSQLSLKKYRYNYQHRFCSNCQSFTKFTKLKWEREEQIKYQPVKCDSCSHEYCHTCRETHPNKPCILNKNKQCPRCSYQIIRNEGCNHMTCGCSFLFFKI